MADRVLILTGPPGAGKTTTARGVAERFERAVHVESDLFFDFIRTGFIEPWKPESHAQNASVMRIVAAVAAGYAGDGYFTVVDGIVLPRWFFEPLRDALKATGQGVAYAVLRAPLEVCVARVAERDVRPLADAETLEGIWRQFADLGGLESHAIDVAGATPAEAADAVMRRLRDGSLDV